MRGRDEDLRRNAGANRAGWRLNLVARLRAYLFAGIIVTAPISITLLIVWDVVDYFDVTVATLIPARYNPETYMPFSLPGIGFLMALGFVILVGWFAAGFVGRTVMRGGESLLDRTPVVRAIYGTLKQIFETLFTQSNRAFREVVLVQFPRPGMWALGLVTGRTSPELRPDGVDDLVNVLVPMSPFPSSGFLLFVPDSEVIHLDMTVEQGMKVILSGGIVAPNDLPRRAQARREPPGSGGGPGSAGGKNPDRLAPLEEVKEEA